MITIHLHTPESPDCEEYAVNALSDLECTRLPTQFYGSPPDVSLHLVNELAYDAFRLAVAQGEISPANVRVRIHMQDRVIKGRINSYGVLLADDGSNPNFKSPSCSVSETIIISTVNKRKLSEISQGEEE